MTNRTMIRMDAPPRRFNFRVAGLGFRDGHVLVHRATHEKFWSFPGGRVEIGETSVRTLEREMVEELGVAVTVGRMLWMVENFFQYEDREVHELGFYYLMDIPGAFPFHPDDVVHRVKDGGSDLEFRWVRATTAALKALDIPPYFIADEIETLPPSPVHVVWNHDDPER
ncbi:MULTISPECIES: NUDIX hydrolase [unclassified Rhizobium]|uniref:NUDIX hydrolase n=1 Tax=unclassified Rhizobium TaxID=2613769 RepID=UPI0007140943|nr:MULTISPECIES: NUDIX hydrolase [unclassified Rhizobium]KQS84194.1 DNA mismatch repair protein MutT [Rhizobium sp. Leaf386]KQT00819.1 DNA mismatch repair protein MutT [Rhizobium sp. Leaf391]KQU08469.1 DNA mismatch repair protein MutT [Rhizobium sp. Leaf453]